MRVLIATNQLARLSGSEIVAREWAEHFRAAGAEVTVFANWKGPPLARILGKSGLRLLDRPEAIRPLSFDLVYLQHHVAGLFDYDPHPDDRKATTILFGRLSPSGFFESGGWEHEAVLGDAMVANSPETARALQAAGVTLPVHVIYNAAPAAFHRRRRRRVTEKAPRSILVVTNHGDPNLMAALSILRRSAEVLHVGRGGDVVTPVHSKLIWKHDVVVSIGKTVQYALASRTPVFVYDHLGGPGYLTASNFEKAADLNFSGRCTPRQAAPEEIASEILMGYQSARKFALAIEDAVLARFHLPTHLQTLAALPPSPNKARRKRLLASWPAIHRERLLAAYVRESFRARQAARGRAK